MASAEERWKPRPELRGYFLDFAEQYGSTLRTLLPRPNAEMSYHPTHDGLFWDDEFTSTLMEDRDFRRAFPALISMRSLRLQGAESPEAAALFDEILSFLNGWAFCEPDRFSPELQPNLARLRRETYRGLLRIARDCKKERESAASSEEGNQ